MSSPSEAGVPHPSAASGPEAGNRLRRKACGHRPVRPPGAPPARGVAKKEKVLPPCGRRVLQMRPPCISRRCFNDGKAQPEPARPPGPGPVGPVNRSKIWGRSSGGMPRPVSSTETTAWVPSRLTRTRISPPSGGNFRASSRRFVWSSSVPHQITRRREPLASSHGEEVTLRTPAQAPVRSRAALGLARPAPGSRALWAPGRAGTPPRCGHRGQ
jgi:hypothetical protein